MDISHSIIDSYLHRIRPGSPAPLDRMEAYARAHRFPIIGPLVGRILQQMVLQTGARRVFELGSGFGYSAIWMAKVLPADGRVICTDGDEKNRDMALSHFEEAGVSEKVEFRVGDALAHLEKESGPFDIILNDIDKEGYPDTIEPVKARLRPGGVFITDNVIWSGRVFDGNTHESTRAIQEFTRRLYADDDFIVSIIPVRDGIAIAVKK